MVSLEVVAELINSTIAPRYEDTRQSAWLRVLTEKPARDVDVIAIARECNTSDRNQKVAEQHTLVYIHEPRFSDDKGTLLDKVTIAGLACTKLTPGEYRRKCQERLWRQRRQRGLCRCGKKAEEDRVECRQCLDKATAYRDRRRGRPPTYRRGAILVPPMAKLAADGYTPTAVARLLGLTASTAIRHKDDVRKTLECQGIVVTDSWRSELTTTMRPKSSRPCSLCGRITYGCPTCGKLYCTDCRRQIDRLRQQAKRKARRDQLRNVKG